MHWLIINPGSILYRFVNERPGNVQISFRENKGKDGRFNKNESLTYYSLSVDDLMDELGRSNKIMGSMLTAIVQKPVVIVYPDCETEFNAYRAINTNKVLSPEFKCAYRRLSFPFIPDYEITNDLAHYYLKKPWIDGIGYSSAQGLNLMANGRLYYLGKTNEISPFVQNIALKRQGYDKLKIQPPVPYWHLP